MSNNIREIVDEIQYSQKLSQEEIAKRLGYSRPYLTEAINKGTSKNVLMRLRKNFPEIVQKITNSTGAGTPKEPATTPDMTILNLSESNRMMAEAHLIMARAHLKEVDNIAEVTGLLKQTMNTNSSQPSLEDVIALRIQGLQKVLVDLGKGKLWKNEVEAQDYIHRKSYEGL